MTSTIESMLAQVLAERGEIVGTEIFALEINARNKAWLRRVVRRLGWVIIIPSNGGRGNKTIYRRNRNQPGQRRRRP